MNPICVSGGRHVRMCLATAAAFLLVNFPILAGQSVQQVVPLQAGWNAVYLYVFPQAGHPDEVFAGLPVEQVNVWLPSRAQVDSLTDPDAVPDKASEWNVWHPPTHPAAFLNTLHRVPARRGMLIKASAPTTWIVRGEPLYQPVQWRAPAFSLVGFDVDAAQPPTFARWFAGSPAHADMTIRKLVNGQWQPVNPQETLQRGVAYWVWTRKGSDFQGPLHVDMPVRADGHLALPNAGVALTGALVNRGSLPMSITLSHEGSLPLHHAWGGIRLNHWARPPFPSNQARGLPCALLAKPPMPHPATPCCGCAAAVSICGSPFAHRHLL